MLKIDFSWTLVLVLAAAIVYALFLIKILVGKSSKNRRPIDPKDLIRIKMPTLTWPSDIGKPAMQQKYITMYAPTTYGTPRQFFESLGVPLDRLCFSFEEISKNAKDLLTLSGGSFIALYEQKSETSDTYELFVYYGFRHGDSDGVNTFSVESNILIVKPSDNIGIFIPRHTKFV
jgi:hypothetical protein